MQGHFVWADLSTYDLKAAKADYAALFGWQFNQAQGYAYATLGDMYAAGMHLMPDVFANMNLPSFWMSHVHVTSIEDTLDIARQYEQARIDLGPADFGANARGALIRDPLGAGFMIYEGPDIPSDMHGPGFIVQRYHHSDQVSEIEQFYGDLFGWTFDEIGNDPFPKYAIRHPDSTIIGYAENIPKSQKGSYQYWIPAFGVADMKTAQRALSKIAARLFLNWITRVF